MCYPLSGSARLLIDDAKVWSSQIKSKFFFKLFANTTGILDTRQTLDFNHSVCFYAFYLAFCLFSITFAAKMKLSIDYGE